MTEAATQLALVVSSRCRRGRGCSRRRCEWQALYIRRFGCINRGSPKVTDPPTIDRMKAASPRFWPDGVKPRTRLPVSGARCTISDYWSEIRHVPRPAFEVRQFQLQAGPRAACSDPLVFYWPAFAPYPTHPIDHSAMLVAQSLRSQDREAPDYQAGGSREVPRIWK